MTDPSHRRLLERLGYQGIEPALLRDATQTSSRAFGALEHLGDCIADLAIGIAMHRAGHSGPAASELTSNRRLDEVYRGLFRDLVHARTGDVVESLIGAVHLDGGFDEAARVAVRLCGDGLEWHRLGHRHSDRLLENDEQRCPTWLGAIAVEALVADHAIAVRGVRSTSQRELHGLRLSMASNEALAAAASTACSLPADDMPTAVNERARMLRRSVGLTLLECGWRRTAGLLLPHLPPIR